MWFLIILYCSDFKLPALLMYLYLFTFKLKRLFLISNEVNLKYQYQLSFISMRSFGYFKT